MKKRLIVIILVALFLVGCSNKDAIKFKEDYEALNGKTNANGKVHRVVNIDENNPHVEVSAEEVLKRIENNESFYVYFGDELCPWCRSVIEKSIEVALAKNIDKIYYVKIWDKDGNEVLRSKYKLNDNNEKEEVFHGTESYFKLLDIFKDLLSDYTLTDKDGNKVEVNEKRIYAPNFIYVKDGKPIKLVEGISSLQKDSREELTKEMLDEEETIFKEFFNN